MRELRIIFIGTSEFAVPSLKILIKNNFDIVAAITAPDKPKGRGQKLAKSPVKNYAEQESIPVLQPANLKSPEFIEELKSYNADLQVVIAFRMLPEIVWNMPVKGTFNLHASLLPQYRGAAPINWAIINGEKETGITTFFLKHEIDTGMIIFQEKEPIYDDDTAGTLYQRLKDKGAVLVLKTVLAIGGNSYPQQAQTVDSDLIIAPKLYKESREINWDQPAERIVDFVRGLSPNPASWTTIKGDLFKIFSVSIINKMLPDKLPGEYITDNKSYLYFKSKDKFVGITHLQKQGKKPMLIKEFLRGSQL